MKTIFTLLIFLGCTFSISAQTQKQSIADIDNSINGIKKEINSYQKIEKINNSDGNRFVFLKDKELKLITVKALETKLEKNVEWYYLNGQLAYCETNWVDTKTKAIVFHEKYYLNNCHLIAWFDSKNNLVDNSSAEFKKLGIDLVAYGEKIKNEATK